MTRRHLTRLITRARRADQWAHRTRHSHHLTRPALALLMMAWLLAFGLAGLLAILIASITGYTQITSVVLTSMYVLVFLGMITPAITHDRFRPLTPVIRALRNPGQAAIRSRARRVDDLQHALQQPGVGEGLAKVRAAAARTLLTLPETRNNLDVLTGLAAHRNPRIRETVNGRLLTALTQ
jgi:hypothetical protein